MNNGNETLGLSVITTNPQAFETNVNVNNAIEITFSGDVNKSTLNNSIIVLEDYNGVYNGVSSLKSIEQYNTVQGTVTYADRVLKFLPFQQLNIDMRYIIVLNNTILDITGNQLLKKFVFTFNTEITKSYSKTVISSPDFGAIVNTKPTIQWVSQNAPSYILQISKANSFEVLLYETFVVGDDSLSSMVHTPDYVYKEGIYYVRIKAEGGEWSEPCQFFVKIVTDAVVAMEDQSEEIYLDNFLKDFDDEIEILEMFPADNSVNISLKTNIFYIKIRGEILENRLSLPEFEVIGEAFDEEDDISYENGTLNGVWSFIYDNELDCTYLIFTPQIIGLVPHDNEEPPAPIVETDKVVTESVLVDYVEAALADVITYESNE